MMTDCQNWFSRDDITECFRTLTPVLTLAKFYFEWL